MRYTVVTSDAVDQQLTDIYLRATDKQAVRAASDRIDRILKTMPERQGEEYGDDRRLVIDPLAVVFHVLPDDCQVQILQYEYLEP
jgi:hypothetical protein